MKRLSTSTFENELTSKWLKALNFEIMASVKLNRSIKYMVISDTNYLRSLYYNLIEDVVPFVPPKQHSTCTLVSTVLKISHQPVKRSSFSLHFFFHKIR